jgi:transcriptional regulator with XRE-family HTH domain
MSDDRPRRERTPIGEVFIGERLRQAEDNLSRRRGEPLTARDICDTIRKTMAVPLAPSTYSLLRSDKRSPTVQQLIALARMLEVTPEFLLGQMKASVRFGIQWARRISALTTSQHRSVTAANALLSGAPLTALLCDSLGLTLPRDEEAEARAELEWQLGRLAQSAVFLGAITVQATDEAVDDALSTSLRECLIRDAELPEPLKSRLQVTVVRNPVHESFHQGGHLGPVITGNYASKVLADFLEDNVHAGQMGLAGGFHVASMVRQIGNGAVPWPERSYRLYPLTIEPFSRQISLGDALVGEMVFRLSAQVGPNLVQGYSLRAFGYLTDDGDVVLRQRSITTVLDQLTELDAVVMGVGDSVTPDGPLQRVLATQGYRLQSPDAAMADVCLNPINANGELLPLRPRVAPEARRIAQLIGIDTEQLRRMAQIDKHRLVLLIASGAKKANSTLAIVRGGFVNHVVCDDRLARALLAMNE